MNLEQLVQKIHATPNKGVIIPTGGGTEVFPLLLAIGGGSNTLLDGQIPYKEFQTDEILGGKPEKYVSELTARQLAMAAYQKAVAIRAKDTVSYPDDTEDYPVFGVACTVSLQKTPEERAGRKHYIYAALQTGRKTVSLSAEIDPAKLPVNVSVIETRASAIRRFEEHLTARVLIDLIAEACGLSDRLNPIEPFISFTRRESTLDSFYLESLLEGEYDALVYHPDQGFWVPLEAMHQKQFILPGSFRPATPAHFEMADYVDENYRDEKLNPFKTFFELSIRNAAKPPLDYISLEERLKTTGNRQVWITNAPTFKDKARIFPLAKFVVGFDTAARIIDPKYADINEVIQAFTDNEVTFAVFGRSTNGAYNYELGEFPAWFKRISFQVTYVLANAAVSSTAIRAAERAAGSTAGDASTRVEGGTPTGQGRQESNQK
jgi:hypothetical protein